MAVRRRDCSGCVVTGGFRVVWKRGRSDWMHTFMDAVSVAEETGDESAMICDGRARIVWTWDGGDTEWKQNT